MVRAESRKCLAARSVRGGKDVNYKLNGVFRALSKLKLPFG